ncbi:MAG: signal recognition particle-docking protein FtsY [Oscillospiraceae bacterium]|jgi:fused signal recognition particle receptor|nr:signal recognition particle-docking protein FtsY [Oscillospiraceae bacterium]
MGFFEKIKTGLAKTRNNISGQLHGMLDSFTGANEDFFDELEETLIMADLGAELAVSTVDTLRERVKKKGIRGPEIRQELEEILSEVLDFEDKSIKTDTKPSIILVTGVNGVGKTTTIGKLASRYVSEGKKVLLCAGDTFRAAAAEQLSIWAERSGADIVRHEEGSDPGAVVFDGISAAKARGSDVIICDTAGRLHNKANLMNELGKISRIIDRELPGACRENLLVIDAATGQNGLIQAKQFGEAAKITGIVLTKLDGTARGGIVFAVAKELGIPVKLIGVGEKTDDLLDFNAAEFVKALLE